MYRCAETQSRSLSINSSQMRRPETPKAQKNNNRSVQLFDHLFRSCFFFTLFL